MSSTATIRDPSMATAKTPTLFPPVRKSPQPSENNSEAELQTNSPNGSVSGGTILDRTKALEMMNNEAANVSSVGNRWSGKNSGVGIFQSTPIRSSRGPSLFPPDAPKLSKQVTLGKKGSDRNSDTGSNVPAEGKLKLGCSSLSTNDDNIIDFDSIDQEGTNAPISRFVAGLPKTPAENELRSLVQHQTDNQDFKGKVPHQGITFKEEWGFDPKMPSVKINTDQIPDEDVIPYRDQYPEVKDEPLAASQDAQEPSDRENSSNKRRLTGRKRGRKGSKKNNKDNKQPSRTSDNAHKTIVQNTPKPGKYGGSTNYAIFAAVATDNKGALEHSGHLATSPVHSVDTSHAEDFSLSALPKMDST
ncbi:hypothetical protein BT96DRAFT_1000432 [Gymnopus androsaceus JB14]|uniref:Uncharacterized protein n=1 Tax=Gymnopus androsaceus JB14 TaxID=1447944 RepID=A0A6A4H5C7_9AGAR|nr:hypothetical protein BT96DRAFT_1000432 [Gymnopus androsaceus JB14]